MPATVHLTHDYAAPPDSVWQVATDWECLKKAMDGLVEYDPLPSEPLAEGQTIRTKTSLFGKLPPFDYVMEVVRYDPENHILASHEYGGGVKSWDHTLAVTPHGDGSRLTDEIKIDAGATTWLYALWAKFIYRRRHKPRLEMLGLN